GLFSPGLGARVFDDDHDVDVAPRDLFLAGDAPEDDHALNGNAGKLLGLPDVPFDQGLLILEGGPEDVPDQGVMLLQGVGGGRADPAGADDPLLRQLPKGVVAGLVVEAHQPRQVPAAMFAPAADEEPKQPDAGTPAQDVVQDVVK